MWVFDFCVCNFSRLDATRTNFLYINHYYFGKDYEATSQAKDLASIFLFWLPHRWVIHSCSLFEYSEFKEEFLHLIFLYFI